MDRVRRYDAETRRAGVMIKRGRLDKCCYAKYHKLLLLVFLGPTTISCAPTFTHEFSSLYFERIKAISSEHQVQSLEKPYNLPRWYAFPHPTSMPSRPPTATAEQPVTAYSQCPKRISNIVQKKSPDFLKIQTNKHIYQSPEELSMEF